MFKRTGCFRQKRSFECDRVTFNHGVEGSSPSALTNNIKQLDGIFGKFVSQFSRWAIGKRQSCCCIQLHVELRIASRATSPVRIRLADQRRSSSDFSARPRRAGPPTERIIRPTKSCRCRHGKESSTVICSDHASAPWASVGIESFEVGRCPSSGVRSSTGLAEDWRPHRCGSLPARVPERPTTSPIGSPVGSFRVATRAGSC